MAGKPTTETRRPRRRRRLLWRVAVAATLFFVALAVASVVGYQRRVELVNRYLATTGLPFEASLRSLDLVGLSALTMTGVELRLPGTETPFLTFSSTSSNLALDDLLDGNLANLEIAHADVHIDDALVAALAGSPSTSSPEPAPSRSLAISKLSLEDATVTVQLDGLPALKFGLRHQGEDIQIGGGLPVAGQQNLHLSDVTASLDGSPAPAVTIPSVDISFTSGGDAAGLNIDKLELSSPALAITQQLLDSLTADPEKVGHPPSAKPLPFPVTIDDVAIHDLELATPPDLALPVELPFDLPAGQATISLAGGPVDVATDRSVTASPLTLDATASLGDLLALRSLTAILTASRSLTTIATLEADAHVDLPVTAATPAISTDLDIELSGLTLSPDGPRATASQSVTLTGLSASTGNSSARVASLSTTLRPDILHNEKRLDSLMVSGLELEIDPADFIPGDQGASAATPSAATAPWHGLAVTDLAVAEATIESTAAPQLGIPGASATLNLTTTGTAELPAYRAALEDLRITSEDTTLASVSSVTVEADPASVWNQNRIDHLAVDGVNLTLDQQLLDATSRPEDAPVPRGHTPPPPGAPTWTLGELSLTRSTVIVDDLVPGLPPLPLAVSTTLTDIPLGAAGLEAADQPQSVTVSNARLRSRLNPLLDVARFDDVTLHFTFRDIIRRKIDRITIEHPVVFVGEHLFWYVDYFRKFESPAATGAPPSPGWDVRTVEADRGELVLAPKGAPLTELPKLPFSGKTSIVDSKLSFALDNAGDPGQDIGEERPLLSLSVPEGDYPLKSLNLGLEVDLKGLRGEIAFNLPIQQRTNNLVQTLHADELWFKNLGAEKVYLAVTYDQQGIYAQFGGEAYSGYAEGAFNLYNDDAYSWDGWVAGTAVDLSPLTGALTPEYLEMSGVADARLIAQGNFQSFDSITATASVTTAEGGGKIDILSLKDLGESLLEEAEPVAATLTKAGLDVVRYFEYDTAKIDVEMFGREGDAILDLRGPSGLRHIHITAHDYRNHDASQ